MGPPSHQYPPFQLSLPLLVFPLLSPKQESPYFSPLSLDFFPKIFRKIESLMQNVPIPGGGGGGGAGGGVSSGGSMPTLSREVVSSEESSPYPDESELELGLGLSLGGGGGGRAKNKPPPPGGSWDQYARILTAKDFPSVVSAKDSSSSSSSASVTKAKNNGFCGTKRTAEPTSPPCRSGVSQVVGWPPIRNYRMNSLVNHAKTPAVEEFTSTLDTCKSKNVGVDKANYGSTRNNIVSMEKGPLKTSLYVKVNMEEIAIGRKVDLNAHSCYETLARTLDDMFRPGAAVGARRSDMEEQAAIAGTRPSMRLLDCTSDFVLIYEDKEGDWMLVGDVPWEMFLSSVRRLRIMKTAEANGLAPRTHERTRRESAAPV